MSAPILKPDFTFSQNSFVFTIGGGKTMSENSENDENRFKWLSRYPTTDLLSRSPVAKEQCDNRDNRFKRGWCHNGERMWRPTKRWLEFEDAFLRRPPNYEESVRVFEALVAHARALGKWPPEDPLEGIENDIRLARILNALPTARKDS